MVQRKRNKIHGLFVGKNAWCTDSEALKEEVQLFFNNLFCVDVQVIRNYFLENRTPTVATEDRLELVQSVSLDKVRCAVMIIHLFKALGADDFQAFFFKQYWHILGHNLHNMVAEAFRADWGGLSLLETLVVLIPNVEDPLRFGDLRPISLWNVAYKMITKVLVNRFRPLLVDLVSPFQGSFISGQGTKDNIILAQEVMHTLHTHKRRGSHVALNCAVDHVGCTWSQHKVSWDFLCSTLHDFGFPPSIVQLIMWGVQEANISILWNRAKLLSFTLQHGLRQGDPLSPYLFVLCMERLAIQIQKLVDEGS